MNEECVKELFSKPITIEALEVCVPQILKKVELVDKGSKIILRYNGSKVGYLLNKVPIEEVKVMRYWSGPFGLKTELSYEGKFVGVLMIVK
ncbi:hypothetical protein [Caldisericum sp.]|jgi:hypothetical protein|uniref:hypothetical protein n=1 Tax=Caldisericum sp. TaxID=2499687 RepID=UPI003D0B4B4F